MRRALALCFTLTLLAACNPSNEDVQELRTQQKQIIAKLADLDKKVDRLAGAGAAGAPAAARNQPPDPNKIYDLPVGSSPVKGPANAPVTIVEFSDYQCPFCSKAEPLIHEALKAYPEQVKVVFKNYPLVQIHPFAMGAAKAAVAAGMQGKYWEMHDVLFANQRELGPEKLKEYAQRVGLDVAKWEKDVQSPQVQQQVDEQIKLASVADVRGTPTLFVNGKRLENRSSEGMKAMIDDALKGKKG